MKNFYKVCLMAVMMVLATFTANAQKVYSTVDSTNKAVFLKMTDKEVAEWKNIQKKIASWNTTKVVANNAVNNSTATTVGSAYGMSTVTGSVASNKVDDWKKKETEFVKKHKVTKPSGKTYRL